MRGLRPAVFVAQEVGTRLGPGPVLLGQMPGGTAMTGFAGFDAGFGAVVIGASGGLGAAFVSALAAAPEVGAILALSRRGTAAPSAKVTPGRLDLQDEASIAAAAGLAAGMSPRLVIVATGMLHTAEGQRPEKRLADLDPDQMARSFAINAIGPALVAKHFVAAMPRDGRSVFAALSARVGSISDNRLGGWLSYRSSKAALNQTLKTIAIEMALRRKGLIVLGLHPGTVDTGLSAPYQSGVRPEALFTPQHSAAAMLDVIGRAGAEHSGAVLDFAGVAVPA